jgi:hypothetical protein
MSAPKSMFLYTSKAFMDANGTILFLRREVAFCLIQYLVITIRGHEMLPICPKLIEVRSIPVVSAEKEVEITNTKYLRHAPNVEPLPSIQMKPLCHPSG